MKYIIKISPEITIKSKPVRKRAFLMLKNNIKKHFEFDNIDVILSGNRDQIELKSCFEDDNIKNILKNIP
jgi:thiamine biosynthesis protein ThiI